jgi:hypothetical protein
MKKLLLILGLTFTFTTNTAYASCAGPFTTQDYIGMADVVVIGTAESRSGSYINFHVDRYYKGSGEEKIKVTGQESPGSLTSVDFDFETGKDYLLFLRNTDGGNFKTTQCAGNQILASSQSIPAELGSGSAPDTNSSNENLGWFAAIVGYGYILPILLWLAIAYLAYIVYIHISRTHPQIYQKILASAAIAYIIFYFYIQRVV